MSVLSPASQHERDPSFPWGGPLACAHLEGCSLSELDDLLTDLDSSTDSGGSGQSSAGGKLRQQLEAVLAQNKQLQDQLAQVQTNERNRSIEALFDKHQIPALAKDFFPSDAQPTDEAATSFVERYGQLWGASSATATTPPDQQAQTAAMQAFQAQSAAAVTSELSEADYAAKFAEANSKAELLSMLAQYGSAIPD